MKGIIYTILFLISAALFTACNNTRHLPSGDTLYLGSDVSIKDKEVKKSLRKVIKNDLEDAIRPKPNKKILGVRFKLGIYNFAGETKKKKGFRYWLRNKVGEPPVLGSQFDVEKNRQILANILENRGFFYPKVTGSSMAKNKKSWGKFEVYTGPQYEIRNVEFIADSSKLSRDVLAQKENTILEKEKPYNLDMIKGERERIDKQLKEIGYYYFRADYLLARVDSTVGNHQVDIFMKVKEGIPDEATRQYTINDVFIFPDYRMGRQNKKNGQAVDTTVKKPDTLFYERYYIVGNTKKYKPMVFTQAMQFVPGDLYNRTDQNISLNRLVNMGTFKFVKNDFAPIGTNKLNAFYYLTSYPKKSMRAEISGLTKNDSRVGSQLSLSWRNRNTLKGAEVLAIKGTAGFETQFGGAVRRPNTYQFGIEPSITFPRFVVPFLHPTSSSVFVPRTIIRTGYDLLLRQKLYALHSFKGGYGYIWKEDIRKEHQFFPVNITYVKTDTLNKDTTLNISYNNLVFNGIIIGPTYQYTYNSRGNGTPHMHDIYLEALADLSGNTLGLLEGANVNDTPNDGPKKLLGTPYAQYVKLQADLRYYLNYNNNPNSIWANRIFIGFGYPYGNSAQLPNIKQFFSGGNSSLRGFPSRLVGPGTFYYKEDSSRVFIETSGDLKLELNSELRAQLINFLHGAIFIDAGNIWTYRKTSTFGDKGKFERDFIKEIAVSTGVGLRFDFKILVVRLDLAFPLRKPWLPEEQRWVFNNLKFGDPSWRRENLILNLGIGYPF